MAPKTPQDGPKIAPRRSWRGAFSMSKTVLDFGASWAPFWVPFGFPFGSQEVPKRLRKAVQNWSKFSVRRRAPPRGPKRPPRGSQEAPKRLPRGPKRTPGGPQKGLTWPSCEREAALEFSSSGCLLGASWGLWGASGEPLGASWGPLGCLLGASSLAHLSFA